MKVALIKSYTEKPWRSPETYQLIENSLKEKWEVQSIVTQDAEALFNFLTRLQKEERESIFVFNIAEFLDEKNKVNFLPALLEKWQMPHLGSSAKAIEIGLDKARTKALLIEKGIPTPQYFVVKPGDSGIQEQAKKIGYPFIVKPLNEGGHIGIRNDSIVYDDASLDKIINRVFDLHHQPALVEEFITGQGMREFSVGVVDGEIRLFTPVEIDFPAMNVENRILSYEVAQQGLEKIKLVEDVGLNDELINLSERTFDAIGAYDYSRVDLRMNHTGCYVLEINIMPGLGSNSFLPDAIRDIHGLAYNQLIQRLAEHSMGRQKSQSD